MDIWSPSEGEWKILCADSVFPPLPLSEEVLCYHQGLLSSRVEAGRETTETGKSGCGEEDDV